MCVVVTKLLRRALAARLQEKVIQVAARNFAERICMCRAAVTGHEVSSNCSRYKKEVKLPGRTYCIPQTYRREEYYYEIKFKSLCNWT